MKKKIFLKPGNVHGNVHVGANLCSSHEQFKVYADRFNNAAQSLASDLEFSYGYHDLDGCPIAFLMRHALELYFKAIALCGNNILEMAWKQNFEEKELYSKQGHSLKYLIGFVLEIFDKVLHREWPSDMDGVLSLNDLKIFINELDEVDNGSFSFRYPIDKQGKPSKSSSLMFNIIDFIKTASKLCEFLEGVCDELGDIHDNLAECIADREYEYP